MLGNKFGNSSQAFLQTLRSDTAGNVYAMAAAALFPIAAIIGGGVDIGRAYMAQARLQQACDAGALAGRRAMSGATLTASDKAEARKFFDFNFPENSFDTDSFAPIDGKDNPRFVDGPEGEKSVNGYMQTTMNTSIMRIFGYKKMTLKADCTSRLDIGNVDVMMVLDVTGSMGDSLSGSSQNKLEGLKDAVESFYDILGPGGGASGSQIRYGFVPYNALVNVGEDLYKADPSWLVGGVGTAAEDEWNYQTRKAHWVIPEERGRVFYEQINVAGADGNDKKACQNKFGKNKSTPPLWNPSDSGYGSGTPVTKDGVTYRFEYYSYKKYSNSYKRCKRRVTTDGTPEVKLTEWQEGAEFDFWEHGKFDHDVSVYVASIDSTNPTALRPTLTTNRDRPPVNETDGPYDRWEGCIEERDTNASITASTTSIPNDAYDLDIDRIPDSKETRWRPYWPGVEYVRPSTANRDYNHYDSTRYQDASTATCPAKARRLAQYSTYNSSGVDSDGNVVGGSLKNYINALDDGGTTNHTIGMIWGARYLSPDGLFAEENSKSGNGFNISRHLIFMTDGNMNVDADEYNVYGLNELDGRLGPTSLDDSGYQDRQEQRFQLICEASKRKGYTVWVVQFTSSSTVGSHLRSCATSDSHASSATSNAALQAAFGDIAKTIGGLRLSK